MQRTIRIRRGTSNYESSSLVQSGESSWHKRSYPFGYEKDWLRKDSDSKDPFDDIDFKISDNDID